MSKNSGRKMEHKYENPIDNTFIALSDKVSPIFKSMNFTPNGITTLSTIFSGAALYELYYKNTTNFTIYVILSFFFDVMDGYYARKYNMVTKEGDQYDHYKDIISGLIFVYILYSRYNITNSPILLIVLIVLFCLNLLYVGCQEVLASKENKSATLEFAQTGGSAVLNMDTKTCKQRLGILKWFGPGSFVLITILAVLYLNGDLDFGLNKCKTLLSSDKSGIVPGFDDMFDKSSSSSPSPGNDIQGIVGLFDDTDGVFGTIETVGPHRINTALLNDLKTFGTSNLGNVDFNNMNLGTSSLGTSSLGTSTLGPYDPYSTNDMVNNLFRD